MTDPQIKADRLAEVIGWWRREQKPWRFWLLKDGTNIMSGYSWVPQDSIEQCFKYVVPAMRERGYDLYLEPDAPGSSVYTAYFIEGAVPLSASTGCSSGNPALAIFEAACLAAGIED